MFLARIYVTLNSKVNDPQGLAVRDSLQQMGFASVSKVRVGKYLEISVDEENRDLVENMVTEFCQKLVASSVTEEFSFDLVNDLA